MRIFLSYSSEDGVVAEEINLRLVADGHDVFHDRSDLTPGAEYDARIEKAIGDSDRFVFLVTPDSVKDGRYTRTELLLAQRKWESPGEHVLPVMVRPTPFDTIPPYLRAVSILTPQGNVAAEVATHFRHSNPFSVRQRVSAFIKNHRTLIALGAIVLIAFGLRAPLLTLISGGPPQVGTFDLKVRVGPDVDNSDTNAPLNAVSFLQKEPPTNRGIENLARQVDDYFHMRAVEIAAGQTFLSELKPPVYRGSYVPPGSPINEGLEICFQRSNRTVVRESDVRFTCEWNGQCELERGAPAWVEDCPYDDRGPRVAWFPRFVRDAWAQDGASGRWEVPTLETLKQRGPSERTGYTIFRITADARHVPADANAFTYAITVNGTPVWVDGWQPEDVRLPLVVGQHFLLDFGLENLDFSGMNAGVEHIEVTLRFLKDQTVLATRPVAIEYIALRSMTSHSADQRSAADFLWSAQYTHPVHENKFQVFVVAGGELSFVERAKRLIDASGQFYLRQPIVGVIRPPLNQNPNYGVVLGVREQSGQIRFTFDAEEVATVCRRALELRSDPGLARVISPQAYRYEMEPRRVGRNPVVQCRNL